MTGLSERIQGPIQRTIGPVGRLSDGPLDLQEVALVLVDGTRIRGMLHRTAGTRTLDFLNRHGQGFVAITDAEVVHLDITEHVSFVAVNKAHIVQLIETVEP